MWIFGSGFPKSLDVSKAIDKEAGATREVVGRDPYYSPGRKQTIGNGEKYGKGKSEDESAWLTSPATEAAREWEGWGTALKPAHEPICVARKPLSESTVAKNFLKWGTGGINVDGCRIDGKPRTTHARGNVRTSTSENYIGTRGLAAGEFGPGAEGRFPANLLLSEQAAAALDEQTGVLKSGSRKAGVRKGMGFHGAEGDGGPAIVGNSGGASRFFFCAKASRSERNAGLEGRVSQKVNDGRQTAIDNPFQRGETERLNTHPTVKPIALMAYLCRLITPPNGLVLDPFAGSGSTGVGALREGFRFVGIEREAEYVEIATRRLTAP
jgi:site-specific DNA-methyltransferase (adenine-specific)